MLHQQEQTTSVVTNNDHHHFHLSIITRNHHQRPSSARKDSEYKMDRLFDLEMDTRRQGFFLFPTSDYSGKWYGLLIPWEVIWSNYRYLKH